MDILFVLAIVVMCVLLFGLYLEVDRITYEEMLEQIREDMEEEDMVVIVM